MKKGLYKIELSKEAEIDFDNSYEFYANISQKVADNYFKEVNDSFIVLSKYPESFQKVFGNARRYVLIKFPVVIYYLIHNTTIQVIAIFHADRNPDIWKQRMDDKDWKKNKG